MCVKVQKFRNSQNIRQESWNACPSWKARLITKLVIKIVLSAKRQKRRPMEQNKAPRNRTTYKGTLWFLIYSKRFVLQNGGEVGAFQ